MKILCVSDTHMYNDIFEGITKRYPDMDYYLHCGDSSLPVDSPLLKKYYVVKGNHDMDDFPLEIRLRIYSYSCLLIHGHYHEVYQHGIFKEYDILASYMKEHNIQLCFHGHTHIPTVFRKDNLCIINPGSVMMNRANYGYGTYAIITIENHIIDVQFYHHTNHRNCTEEVLRDGEETLKKFSQLF